MRLRAAKSAGKASACCDSCLTGTCAAAPSPGLSNRALAAGLTPGAAAMTGPRRGAAERQAAGASARLLLDPATPAEAGQVGPRPRPASTGVLRGLVPDDGPGAPLDPALQERAGAALGTDLGPVRLHRAADRDLRPIGARAMTVGRDVTLSRSLGDPYRDTGRRALSHELVHVAQQARHGARLDREVDPTWVQVTPSMAAEMEPAELDNHVTNLRALLQDPNLDETDRQGFNANLLVLEAQATLNDLGARDSGTGGQLVDRPPGLPLGGSYQLQPWPDAPPGLVAQVPEGQLTVVPIGPDLSSGTTGPAAQPAPPALSPGPSASSGSGYDLPQGIMTGTGVGANVYTSGVLRSQGFAQAGQDAIGLVAVPRMNPARPSTLRMSTTTLGHTAAYARLGGQIQVVRGFVPDTLPALRNYAGMSAGTVGVPAHYADDVGLFLARNARTIEIPFDRATVEAFVSGVPVPGPSSTSYTARPAVAKLCQGSNCILVATDWIEQVTGAPLTAITPEGGMPLTSLARPGQGPVPLNSGQGPLYRFMGEVDEGVSALADVPGATGPAAAGTMPAYAKVLRVGGRLLIVVDVAVGAYEVYSAPPAERTRTTARVTGGIVGGALGGIAAGAAAGLVCGPGAPVCSTVLGIAGGVIGAIFGESAGEALHDMATGSGGSDAAPCPTCHQILREAEERTMFSQFDLLRVEPLQTLSDAGPASGQPPSGSPGGGLSEAELQMIADWINSPSQATAASR